MISDDDFGFTFEDSQEVGKEIVRQQTLDKESYKSYLHDSVISYRDMIMPLLNNLKKNPEKDTIRWPNREKVITEFLDKLDQREEEILRSFDLRFGK